MPSLDFHGELMKKLLDTPPSQIQGVHRDFDQEAVVEVVPTTGRNVMEVDKFDISKGLDVAKNVAEVVTQCNDIAADMFAASFQQKPVLKEQDQTNLSLIRRHQYLTTLMETNDWKEMRDKTTGNVVAATAAAEELTKEYAKLLATDAQRRTEMSLLHKPTQKKIEDRQVMAEIDLGHAASEALKNISAAMEETDSMGKAMGIGPGQETILNPQKMGELFSKARKNQLIRRVMNLAGRYRLSAQARQSTKTSHGMDDMVGVDASNELGRILPHELAQLMQEGGPRLAALRRYHERQMMSREYRGVERKGKGPVIVCVDESGSMEGESIAHAKAFALAMYWIARHQNRWCVLIGYSGRDQGSLCILPAEFTKTNIRQENVPGGVFTWLTHFFNGGTELNIPLERLPFQWWPRFLQEGMPRGKTDIIIITDDECSITNGMANDFNEWKKREQVKLISMVMNSKAGGLAAVSDMTFLIDMFDLNSQSIQAAFSI